MREVIFNGPEGRIEGKYYQAEDKTAPVVIILHPNPKHEGTMNNRVTYTTFHAFKNCGFSVLRFNFRGVGKSQGQFDNGIGELADAATALDWIQKNNSDTSSIWIAGFSFGAWIGMQLLMRRPEIEGFVMVSPPVNQYDFSFLSPCPTSGLIIQGDEDSIVSESSVSGFSNLLNNQRNIKVEYHIISGADHFFREKLDPLSLTIEKYLKFKLYDDNKPKKVKLDRRRRQLPDDILL